MSTERLMADRDRPALAEAARLLRVTLSALPPGSPTDRATARRIEGAAVTVESLAEPPSPT